MYTNLVGEMEFSERIYTSLSDEEREKVHLTIDDAIADCIEKMTLFRDIEINVKVYDTTEERSVEFLRIKKSETSDALISGVLRVDTGELKKSVLIVEGNNLIRMDTSSELEKKITNLLKEGK